jgi:DNA-directed RNA polymerase specialized sigma subunit
MSSYYINNKEFERLISSYKDDPKEHEVELVKTLDLLISNIFNSFKFSVEFDDAKQDCFVLVLKSIENFNVGKGSAFNYFTTIIINNLRLIYTKNKTYRSKIEKLIDEIKNQYPKLDS